MTGIILQVALQLAMTLAALLTAQYSLLNWLTGVGRVARPVFG
jgi:hypothetical protein